MSHRTVIFINNFKPHTITSFPDLIVQFYILFLDMPVFQIFSKGTNTYEKLMLFPP